MSHPGTSSRDEQARPASVEELADRFEQLLHEIAELRSSLTREIRTRRIVVVEEDGFERVVVGANSHFGHVTVHARTASAGSTCADLFANDPIDGDGPHVGTALTASGDVIAAFESLGDGPPRFWIDEGAKGAPT